MKLLADVSEVKHFCKNSSFKFHYFIGLQRNCNIQPFLEEFTPSVMMIICHSTCERIAWEGRIWSRAKGNEKGKVMV